MFSFFKTGDFKGLKVEKITTPVMALMSQEHLLGGIYLGEDINLPEKSEYSEFAFSFGLLVPKFFGDCLLPDGRTLEDLYVTYFGASSKGAFSTFFKKVSDVLEKPEEEIAFHQMLHYLSTYGGIKELANSGGIYVPNPFAEGELKKIEKITIETKFREVKALDRDKYEEAILKLISINKAYDSAHLKEVLRQAVRDGIDFNGKQIACREARSILVDFGAIEPRSSLDEVISLALNIVNTTDTTFVKNKLFYANLMESVQEVGDRAGVIEKLFKDSIDKYGVDELAKDSNRYRKILITLKRVSPEMGTIINKILKRAKRVSKPYKPPVSQRVFDKSITSAEFKRFVDRADLRSLIKILEVNSEREEFNKELKAKGESAVSYRVRNNREYLKIRTSKLRTLSDEFLHLIERKIKEEGASLLGDLVQDNRVYIERGFDIPLVHSSKNSLGRLPENSIFVLNNKELGNSLSIGVYWDFNADIDLHLVDQDGGRIGWNGRFSANSCGRVAYSGDMTGLNREGFASEYMVFKNLSDFKKGFSYDMSILRYVFRRGSSGSLKLLVSKGLSEDDFTSLKNMIFHETIFSAVEVAESAFSNLGKINVRGDKNGNIIIDFSGRSSSDTRVPSIYSKLRNVTTPRKSRSKLRLRDLAKILGIEVIDVDRGSEIEGVKIVSPGSLQIRALI